MHSPDLLVGSQEPREHRLSAMAIRDSVQDVLHGGDALGHTPPRETSGRNAVEEPRAIRVGVAAQHDVNGAQWTPRRALTRFVGEQDRSCAARSPEVIE